MSVSFIPPIAAIQEPALAAVSQAMPDMAGGVVAPVSFGSMVSNGLQQVSQQLNVTQADLQGLASGNVENLHQVMIRMEESRVAFQLMLQVRNRLLESYQDLMRMQV